MFGQWGLPSNLCGNAKTIPFRKWNQLVDAIWEKAPLTAISPMETSCAQITMFALTSEGEGATLDIHYRSQLIMKTYQKTFTIELSIKQKPHCDITCSQVEQLFNWAEQ